MDNVVFRQGPQSYVKSKGTRNIMDPDIMAFYEGLSTTIDFQAIPEPDSRFEVKNLIGEGTYGEVYKAVDITNQKVVAIKILDDIGENMEEIEEEFRVLSTHWIHPNIPHFIGLFFKRGDTRIEDQIWIAMELCDGGSVADLVTFHLQYGLPGLREEEIAYILNEINHSLDYLHKHNTLHRDVKGSNILLNKEGEVKLIDYGVACELSTQSARRHTSVGTPYWMAPEVILCDGQQMEYDSRCDVWSLGITAIELAEGKAPLSDLHPMRALFQIPRNPPPALKDEMEWSKEFIDFIHECLTKDYEERPVMAEIAEHPFLLNVSQNPTYIQKSLARRIEMMQETDFKGKVVEPTTKNGKLKEKRKEKSTLMLRDDLASLEYISEDIILDNLRRHFQMKQIYVYIGEILLAINPYQDLGLYSSREMYRYRNVSKFDNPPHAFALANHAYHAMIHEKKNQRFVITGESGAGKTVTSNVVMKMLVYLGRAPHRNIEDKILQINPILEAFGNAKTLWNDNSSRFAKIIDLSFSKMGKITGAKIYVFLLEHSRVTMALDNTFHVFKCILQGLQSEGKLAEFVNEDRIHLTASQKGQKTLEDYEQLKIAFKTLGFRQTDLDMIYSILIAIHLLNKVEFQSMTSEGNVDGSGVGDMDLMQDIANLLGVSVSELIHALINSHIATRGEMIMKSNSIRESHATRNALAKGLYSRLFDFVVASINKLLSYSLQVYGESSSIGILDIFGFENFENNSLEQLCINTANEQMNYYFHQFIFCWEREEHVMEDVPFHDILSNDNRDTLDLVLSRPIGLLSLLDEESKFPSSTDKTLTAKLHANLSKYNSFIRPKTDSAQEFTIRHYAFTVTYDPKGFIEKNRNFLSPEIVVLMRRSKYETIQSLFSSPISKHGRLANPTDMEPGRTNQSYSQSRAQQSIATYFRYSLIDLLRITLNGAPHFIRCFKPSRNKESAFDDEYMLNQLRYTGVLNIVSARQEGFTHRLPFPEFLRRYCFLGFSFDERVLATKENCQLLLLRLRMDGYALGKTKVFLKYYHIEYLSKQYETQIRKIVRVQAVVRRWLASLRCQREKWNVARSIFLMKIFATRWKIRTKKQGVLKKSAIRRQSDAKIPPLGSPTAEIHLKRVRSKSTAAVEIQRHIRGYIARKKIGLLLARKVELAVGANDAGEIQKVNQELQEEGLTPDEAARLIQSVFKKLRNKRRQQSLEDEGDEIELGGEASSGFFGTEMRKWSNPEVQSCFSELMQMVHISNVEMHKFLKRNKNPVDIADIKKTTGDRLLSIAIPLDNEEEVSYPNLKDADMLSPIVKPKAYSTTCFYTDSGPREDWDMPLKKHAKQIYKSMELRSKHASLSKPQVLNPIQSMVMENQSRNLINEVQAKMAPNYHASKDPSPQPSRSPSQASSKFSPPRANLTPSPRAAPKRANFIQDLKALQRKGNGSGNDDEEEEQPDGTFDFRTILRKTEFAPTASLRLRKGLSPGRRPPIPKLTPAPPPDEPQNQTSPSTPGVVFNDTVVDL